MKSRQARKLKYLSWSMMLAISCGSVASCSKSESSTEYLKDAEQYHAKGDDKSAVIQLKNALQKDENNAEARYLLGTLYNAEGNYPAAADELQRALKPGVNEIKVQLALDTAYLGMGEFQKVIDSIHIAPALKGDALASQWVMKGDAYLGLNQKDAAKAAFDAALAVSPHDAEASIGIAKLAAINNDIATALQLIDKVIAQTPNRADALLLKGDILRASSQNEMALAEYKKALAVDKSNAIAMGDIASLALAMGKVEEAKAQIDVLKKTYPRNLMGKYLQAMLHFQTGKYALARDDILQVLKAVPDHMPSILLSGSISYQLGDDERAKKDFSRFVEEFPNNDYARKMLAATQLKLKQPVDALKTLAPLLGGKDVQALGLAVEAYAQTGEADKAAQYLAKEVVIEPGNALLRTQLAMSRIASGQSGQAIADLEAAAALDTGHAEVESALVLAYLGNKDYDHALSTAQKMVQKWPKLPLGYNFEGAAYVGKNDLPAAQKSFNTALSVDPNYLPAALSLGQLYLKQENLPAARQQFEAMLAKDKNNLQAMMFLAAIARHTGQGDYVNWLEKAAKANPTAIEPINDLVQYKLRHNQIAAALALAQHAVQVAPKNPLAIDLLGETQIAVKQFDAAVGTYTTLTQLLPRSPLAYFRLGSVQAITKAYVPAEDSLNTALALQPDYPDALDVLVEVYDTTGDYERAYSLVRNKQIHYPRSPQAFILEGDIDLAQKQYGKAVNAYEQAQAVAKTTVAEIKLHNALTLSGKANLADRNLLQWITLHPDDLVARNYLAQVYLTKGDDAAALLQYLALLRKAPGTPAALNNVAWIYQKMKDPRAINVAQQAYQRAPDNPQIMDTLGWMLVQEGDATGGLNLLQKAVAIMPAALDIRYHYAVALVRTGNKIKARQVLQQLLDSNKAFPQLSDAKALLQHLAN